MTHFHRLHQQVQAASLAPTGTKKKDIKKGSGSNTQKVVTRRTAALDVPSVKEKGKVLLKGSREEEGQETEGMETEEEGENGGLFSTPKRGSTSAQEQVESQVQAPSLSTFSTPPNLPAQPVFVLLARAPKAPPLPHHLKLNLKRPADLLKRSPIRKTVRAYLGKSDMDQRIIDILGVVQELVKTVEKQTVEN